MTLNGEMAFILRYFTQFGSFPGALRKSGYKVIIMDNLRFSMSSSKRLQKNRATPMV